MVASLREPGNGLMTEHLDDVSRALDAHGEALLIVDSARQIVWCTSACQQVHAALVQGGYIAVVPELTSALSGVEFAEKCSLNLTLQGAPDSPQVKRYQLKLTRLPGSRTAIRFISRTDEEANLSKYMAEREQLFSTSRSISVSEMATTLAHELNQPIGTVANILKGVHMRLSREDAVAEDITRALSKAGEQIVFVTNIISRIREFTQSRQPSYVECNVHAMISQSIDLLDWVFDSEHVSVHFSMADNSLCVTGDSTMLQQVLTNLCRNGVDAMRGNALHDRQLEVSAYRTDDGIRIDVSDCGEGLSEQAANTVFMPFVTDKANGMGVGLNICRSFVELQHGKLWLTPNESAGCTAHILLPESVAGSN